MTNYTSPSTTLQKGLTLVELMVSLTIGLLIVMAVTALLLSSKSGYATLNDATRIQDTGRFAMDLIARAVHQAGYQNWDKEDAPVMHTEINSADVSGQDAKSLGSSTPDIQLPVQKSVNGSDVLALRYFGSGTGKNGDGTVVNCAGFGVASVQAGESAETGRGWSIFYVATDSTGEPELRCKYYGKTRWTSEAVARGVESFQVLYGVDTNQDGLPNKYLTADALNQMDAELILIGKTAEAKAISKNRKTHWKKIVAINVSLLVRGDQNSRVDTLTNQYDLFGTEYSRQNFTDVGSVIKEQNLPVKVRNRIRKVFQQTIMLKNRSSGKTA